MCPSPTAMCVLDQVGNMLDDFLSHGPTVRQIAMDIAKSVIRVNNSLRCN